MEATEQRARRLQPLGLAVLGLVTLIGFGAPFLPAQITHGLLPWLIAASASAWTPVAAIAAYTVLASLGVPQMVLVTAVSQPSGRNWGLLYSWSGKMLACSTGFFLGRRFGAAILARNASPRWAQVTAYWRGRNFGQARSSAWSRPIPAVLINFAAGATPMCFLDFLAGAAIGSVPTMALLAFGGAAAMHALREDSVWSWVMLGAMVGLYVCLGYLAQRWWQRRKPQAHSFPAAP